MGTGAWGCHTDGPVDRWSWCPRNIGEPSSVTRGPGAVHQQPVPGHPRAWGRGTVRRGVAGLRDGELELGAKEYTYSKRSLWGGNHVQETFREISIRG